MSVQPEQSAPEMAAAAAAAAVVREAAASAVMDVLDAGESEEERSTKLAMAKEDKMRKVIRSVSHFDCCSNTEHHYWVRTTVAFSAATGCGKLPKH